LIPNEVITSINHSKFVIMTPIKKAQPDAASGSKKETKNPEPQKKDMKKKDKKKTTPSPSKK
jgi:hypothetical protein